MNSQSNEKNMDMNRTNQGTPNIRWMLVGYSLALLADTQGRELQSGLSDVSVKLKDKAIAIENRWNTFLNKNYEIRR